MVMMAMWNKDVSGGSGGGGDEKWCCSEGLMVVFV